MKATAAVKINGNIFIIMWMTLVIIEVGKVITTIIVIKNNSNYNNNNNKQQQTRNKDK